MPVNNKYYPNPKNWLERLVNVSGKTAAEIYYKIPQIKYRQKWGYWRKNADKFPASWLPSLQKASGLSNEDFYQLIKEVVSRH